MQSCTNLVGMECSSFLNMYTVRIYVYMAIIHVEISLLISAIRVEIERCFPYGRRKMQFHGEIVRRFAAIKLNVYSAVWISDRVKPRGYIFVTYIQGARWNLPPRMSRFQEMFPLLPQLAVSSERTQGSVLKLPSVNLHLMQLDDLSVKNTHIGPIYVCTCRCIFDQLACKNVTY